MNKKKTQQRPEREKISAHHPSGTDRGSDQEPPVTLLFILFIAAGILVSYSGSLDHEFVFDDLGCIAENPTIEVYDPLNNHSRTDIPKGLRRRPVASWSFTANYRMAGTAPTTFRVTNIVIHLLGALTLFDLSRRLLKLKGLDSRGKYDSSILAFGIASLWAVHPIQTESVTYVVQRIESLMGLFFLLTIYCFYLGSQSQRWPAAWYGLSVLFLSLGMATKEVMIVAPIAVILFDYAFLHQGNWNNMKSRWWVYLAFLPATLWLIVVTLNTDYSNQLKNAELGNHPKQWEYFLTQPGVICEYLRISLFPTGLCFDRNWPLAKTILEIAIPGIFLLVLLTASTALLLRRQALGWVGFCFFLILAPTSSLLPIGTIYFEHRMYLPLACLTTLVALAMYWLIRGRLRLQHPLALAFPFLLTGIALGWGTSIRNYDYQDGKTLAEATLAIDPKAHRSLYNLAVYYIESREYEKARVLLERATRLRNKKAVYQFALADVYSHTNQPSEALKLLDTMDRNLLNDPAELSCHDYQYALAWERTGNWGKSRELYERAIERNPGNTRALLDFAAALGERNQLSLAKQLLSRAIQQEPQNVEANLNMGTLIMVRGGSVDEAIYYFESALKYDPDNALAAGYLARAIQLKNARLRDN